jgi:hypothetical protein
MLLPFIFSHTDCYWVQSFIQWYGILIIQYVNTYCGCTHNVDLLEGSYVSPNFLQCTWKWIFYIVIISLLPCSVLTCTCMCMLARARAHTHTHTHTKGMKSIPADRCSLLFCFLHRLLWWNSFVFQGCRRHLGQVSCSYATAVNVLWGSKEPASCSCSWYVILAREQRIKEQEMYATPSLCSVLGNTCLNYAYIKNVGTNCECKCILQNLGTLQKMWITVCFRTLDKDYSK